MKTFTSQKEITSVKRQTYTGNKSAYAQVYGTIAAYTGYLRPLNEEESSVNGVQFGQGFQLITEIGLDIIVADKITIASQEYTVRAKAIHDRGRNTQYQKMILIKPEAQS